MLTATFCHIPGVGHVTERNLWKQGITSWQHLLQVPDRIARVSRYDVAHVLQSSLRALDSDALFFSRLLKTADAWRLFPHFRTSTAYLDIETTGLGDEAEITTIALYDGDTVATYVNGRNLDNFVSDIENFKILVTYNGMSFDIPFIERFFRTRLGHAQIDLRYVLARLGFRGGLKGCEKQMGINRGALDGMDGSFAVALWHEYKRYGNEAALETLLAYNVEDTVNLERLMVEAYNRHITDTPFSREFTLPYPDPPELLFHPDREIVSAMRQYRY
ncbi:MAG: ribonuclease H-like domain-containing protein [Desulfocapsaceae bacterium]|jgi:uncharacterized protein YprB with RNaseH-like and TPR domain|nr:ribonuclease H-like domain-containing protein [Desulfocapsaceae bacterium]